MPPCNTYRLTWVSLTLDVGYLFTAAPAKRSRCCLPWREGYLLTAALPDLQCGIAPLGSPAPAQPRLLGSGVAPPGRRPWLRAWGNSSSRCPWPFAGYLLSAVPAPSQSGTLGCCSWPPTYGNSSWPLPFRHGVPPASAPDLGRRVAPLSWA